MKRISLLAAFALLLCQLAGAQMSAEYYKSQYERQVKVLGPSGVGVETIINKWALVAPEDGDMLEARFNYYLSRSRTTKVETRDARKYLGEKPMLELKDSLGAPIYYFQVEYYSDSLFVLGGKAIDKAIALYPMELRYRVDKVNSLLSYEKESPDMALSELCRLVDFNEASHPDWTLSGEAAGEDTFIQIVQEYSYRFWRIGTPSSYEAFRALNEKMSKLYPKESTYLSNLGSYYLVAKDNKGKAKSYYKKALKLNPEDYAANKNMRIIQSSQSGKGQPSK